jgi:S1-C subfamily serine protease
MAARRFNEPIQPIQPMTLGNMRANGVRSVAVILTSHGSPDGVAVQAGRRVQTLSPSALARLLDSTGVRHRIAAFAIGNSFGLDQSLTAGIISALKRHLPTSGGRGIANVIQTDAAINPGNSGGPLLDSAGRLIGVNTAIYSPSGSNAGIGFAIPVDVVNRVVPELIRNGRVPTPGIGIVGDDETLAARLGIEGVVVVRTVPGSPADFFCSRLRSALLVERLGTQKRLTPFAFAATSLLAE